MCHGKTTIYGCMSPKFDELWENGRVPADFWPKIGRDPLIFYFGPGPLTFFDILVPIAITHLATYSDFISLHVKIHTFDIFDESYFIRGNFLLLQKSKKLYALDAILQL